MENELEFEDQVRAHQKLLSAVVALAIRDAQRHPMYARNNKISTPDQLALSALYFLFTDSSDGYLTLLDIDPNQFRERLICQMYTINKGLSDEEKTRRANFCKNYRWYYDKQSSVNANTIYADAEPMEAEVVEYESVRVK